jgi:hypothetical protein
VESTRRLGTRESQVEPWNHQPGQRYALHGHAVELVCQIPSLRPEIQRVLGPFAVPGWPDGFSPTFGAVMPFDADAVQRAVSPAATHFAPPDELIELYRDQDRFWVIDDRWGMAELNLSKRQWRSWVLPRPGVDPQHCVELGVLWPLAQLLRGRGLHLVPAVSVARPTSRGLWGCLIFCPFGIEPELSLLLNDGYKLIGQRWTALREEDGRIAMLSVPGWVQRESAPHQRALGQPPPWQRVDLNLEHPLSAQNHAFCDAVLVATPGRRTDAALRAVTGAAAIGLLRRSWPMIDLQPERASLQLPPKLARTAWSGELELSRRPRQLLRLLDELFDARPRPGERVGSRGG